MIVNAKKCDRCGRYYECNKRFPETGYKSQKIIGIAAIRKNGSWYKQYDFCDDCLADFFEFMNGVKPNA